MFNQQVQCFRTRNSVQPHIWEQNICPHNLNWQILDAVIGVNETGTKGMGEAQGHINSIWKGRGIEPKQRQNISQHNAKEKGGFLKNKKRNKEKNTKKISYTII